MVKSVAFLAVLVLAVCPSGGAKFTNNRQSDRRSPAPAANPPQRPLNLPENFIRYQLDGVYKKLSQCTSEFEFIHCLQLYMVERIEKMKHQFGKSGDIKRDFLDKLFKFDGNTTLDDFEIRAENKKLSSVELNAKLMHLSREYYFKNNREARLELIPGYILDIKFPDEKTSDSSMINFSIIKLGRSGRRKKDDLDTLIKLGLSGYMMPIVMVGSVFPFIFPVLKTAAIMSTVLNKAALIGALMYLAKTAVPEYQKQGMYFGGAAAH